MILSATIDNILYVYNENIWTGKKELSLNGVKLNKSNKNTFYDLETKTNIQVKGNFLTGVELKTADKTVVLAKNGTYEWVFIFLPFIIIFVGIFGGAIGGALSGGLAIIGAVLNANIVRGNMNTTAKTFICIAITLISALIWWILYSLIVSLFFM